MELYGVVQWISDHPILDGMDCFVSEEKAMRALVSSPILENVKYTLIRLNVSSQEVLSEAAKFVNITEKKPETIKGE